MKDIKVGEKIRTNAGLIGELIRIERDDTDTSLKWYVFDDGKNVRYINKPYITKHSFNIIDLIEVGDFVNGVLVTGKESTLLYTDIKGIDHSGYHIVISQYGDGIKTILTHEQYERNCYKIN